MQSHIRSALSLGAIALLAGCANLAPTHETPASTLPQTWPTGPSEAGDAGVSALPAWSEFIADERLRQVVQLALDRNTDLRVAALNIERARAQHQIQRSALFPSVDGSLGGTRQQTATAPGPSTQVTASVGLAYELDLFGRVRNLNEAALQNFFAVEENRRGVSLGLVAEVSTSWLTLATDVKLLALARETLRNQQTAFDLTRQAHAVGGVSGLTLAQTQTTVESARADVARYATLVAQDRNALELVAGGPVADGLLPLDEQASIDVAAWVSPRAALPSELLQQRPDVAAAERRLRAANANIGAARAALFPSISLTGSAGRQSDSLSNLFGSGVGIWSIGPRLNLPIFDMGARRAGMAVSQVDRDIAVAQYQRSLQVAFKEVSDALASRDHIGERLAAQQALLEASERSMALSEALYRNGGSSYLGLLDAQRSLYAARQGMLTLQLSEQISRLALYRALGGG